MTEKITSTPISAENIAERARASLSYYCMYECKAMCCRKGYITLSIKEAINILGSLPKSVIKEITIDLSEGCPKLKDNKCTIYKERPQICRDYPVFVKHSAVHLSEKCPAVRENKLYPFEHEFIQKGLRVIRI